MDSALKDLLKTKLVETCLHLEKTEADRKASNAAFNEEIKGGKLRILVLSKSIKSESMIPIVDEFGPEYADELEKSVATTGPIEVLSNGV